MPSKTVHVRDDAQGDIDFVADLVQKSPANDEIRVMQIKLPR